MKSIYKVSAETLGNKIELYFPTFRASCDYLEEVYNGIEKVSTKHGILHGKIERYVTDGGAFFLDTVAYYRDIEANQ